VSEGRVEAYFAAHRADFDIARPASPAPAPGLFVCVQLADEPELRAARAGELVAAGCRVTRVIAVQPASLEEATELAVRFTVRPVLTFTRSCE
jgi:hypothetical protein